MMQKKHLAKLVTVITITTVTIEQHFKCYWKSLFITQTQPPLLDYRERAHQIYNLCLGNSVSAPFSVMPT